MNQSFFWFLLLVFCWGAAVYGLVTGALPDKSRWLMREESPKTFWANMAMWIALGCFMIYKLAKSLH